MNEKNTNKQNTKIQYNTKYTKLRINMITKHLSFAVPNP